MIKANIRVKRIHEVKAMGKSTSQNRREQPIPHNRVFPQRNSDWKKKKKINPTNLESRSNKTQMENNHKGSEKKRTPVN